MATYLTIGEAAERLGLKVDTVRKLAREGKIPAKRTGGGHRRFLSQDIERYLSQRRSGAKTARPGPVTRRRARAPLPALVEESVFEEPLFDEPERVYSPPPARAVSPMAAPPARTASPPVPPAPQRPDPAPAFTRPVAAAQEENAERNRLAAIRNHGVASIPWDVPPHWRARAIADLERYVTAHEFPSRLSYANAIEIVRARVRDFLAPWSQERDAQKARQEAEQRCESLRSHGRSYALRETFSWDWEAQHEARREVEVELKREVEADWDEREVEELVDDILDQWDDEEDE